MYLPFEQGPIRPPSEAGSLLIRVTRNCPWNKCAFCPVYKNKKFSRRTVEEVKQDITNASNFYDKAKSSVTRAFLQDANSIMLKVDDLASIISFLKEKFPEIKRITIYARAKTVAKKEVSDLKKLKEAGLSRIHMGLESGSDEVLKFMEKGATSEDMITAGKIVKESGISLCEYVILGLGGKKWQNAHPIETAKLLNEIDPDFIRARTLAVRCGTPLYEKIQQGKFERLTDPDIVKEERVLIENLKVQSRFVSDHILNLLMEVNGRLPQDKEKLLKIIDRYLSLSDEDKTIFQLGRRLNLYSRLDDLKNLTLYTKVQDVIKQVEKEQSVENFIFELMQRCV